jgi:glyoxylase-like metal-dependent hydrolase (beta-lactamase superfamily II)
MAAKITLFNVGLIPTELTAWFGLPAGHPCAGRTESLPIQFHLISVPGRLVLVDAPAYEFPGDDSILLPEYKGRSAAGLLAESGIVPEAVTDVVITHPHLDHTLGISRPVQDPTQVVFPKARHYLNVRDWNSDKLEEVERRPFEAVQQAGLLTLVEGELDLGDGLVIVPAPGETPGHQVLWLKGVEGEAYIVGDLFHHVLEFEEPGRHPLWADGPRLQASKSMLMERAAESGARVYFTHIVGAWIVERRGQLLIWERA